MVLTWGGDAVQDEADEVVGAGTLDEGELHELSSVVFLGFLICHLNQSLELVLRIKMLSIFTLRDKISRLSSCGAPIAM